MSYVSVHNAGHDSRVDDNVNIIFLGAVLSKPYTASCRSGIHHEYIFFESGNPGSFAMLRISRSYLNIMKTVTRDKTKELGIGTRYFDEQVVTETNSDHIVEERIIDRLIDNRL